MERSLPPQIVHFWQGFSYVWNENACPTPSNDTRTALAKFHVDAALLSLAIHRLKLVIVQFQYAPLHLAAPPPSLAMLKVTPSLVKFDFDVASWPMFSNHSNRLQPLFAQSA